MSMGLHRHPAPFDRLRVRSIENGPNPGHKETSSS